MKILTSEQIFRRAESRWAEEQGRQRKGNVMDREKETLGLIDGLIKSGESQQRTIAMLIDVGSTLRARVEELEERVALLEQATMSDLVGE